MSSRHGSGRSRTFAIARRFGSMRKIHSPSVSSRPMRTARFWLVHVLLAAPLTGVMAAELEVTLEQVATDAGELLVAVCTRETFLRRGCPYTGRSPAISGEAKVVVRGIDPGVYAVQAFHDENGNFDLDRNFLGLPKEGMGFSNDAPMRFGPPSFDDAAIEISAAGAATRLRLRYFD
jgi:uncharacterized protein (DUF2141 family)